MFSYKDIPHEIKESYEINSLRKAVPKWKNRTVLSIYLNIYGMGMQAITEGQMKEPDYSPSEREFYCAASYFVLRKELFKRMSPLVSRRSEDLILLDNKKLLDKFDTCLPEEPGISPETRRYLVKILNRME